MLFMSEMKSRKQALERAVDIIGGQTALAEALGIGQSRVNNWLNRDDQGVPGEFCTDIERLTESKVSCHELRPDIFRVEQAA